MDWSEIEKAALQQGWWRKETKKGYRLVPPDPTKDAVQVHRTPSDVRAVRNHLAEMKRQGLIWPWPPKKGGKKK